MFGRVRLLPLILLLLAGGCAFDKAPVDAAGNKMERLSVTTASGKHDFWVEIADDDAERERGLMHRPPLADDRGMLFEFPAADERTFWMHDTPSPLDIVYIAPDGRIVSIARRAPANSDDIIPSNGAANGVLEVRAGRMDEIGARPGDRVSHGFFR